MTRTDRSLQEIESDDWGDPASATTRLSAEALRLRRTPVGDLSTEDLRLLIGQQIGLDTLIPIAARTLAVDPLTEGDLYPGDLLGAVLRVDPGFWARHPALRARIQEIVGRLPDPTPRELGPGLDRFLGRD
ncbi:MAG TPA: contact-dependent growth inhibition system immunity protein [Actinokineospora sp.]|nr:contact-dependent growth inhibition system immunity protein [Actinokineospora sp.]